MNFTPFTVRLKKPRKHWPIRVNGERVCYEVIAMDKQAYRSVKKPNEIDIDNIGYDEEDIEVLTELHDKQTEQIESVITWLLLANPINGRFDWFDITEVRFMKMV